MCRNEGEKQKHTLNVQQYVRSTSPRQVRQLTIRILLARTCNDNTRRSSAGLGSLRPDIGQHALQGYAALLRNEFIEVAAAVASITNERGW